MSDSYHFDRWQFDRPGPHAVSATTRIAWADFARMHVSHRDPFPLRRPVPEWVLNDEQLREVIVSFLETRAQCGPGTGSLAERMARAEKTMLEKLPAMNASLDHLCREYM